MVKRLPHSEAELNARDVQLRFSPPVRNALHAIAGIARNSSHFDGDIYEIVKAWSEDKPTTIHDFLVSMAPISGEVTRHIMATDDERMKEAWDELCIQLPQTGFTVSQSQQKKR